VIYETSLTEEEIKEAAELFKLLFKLQQEQKKGKECTENCTEK